MTLQPSDKMDPVLEIWIDDGSSPLAVRLHGLLDATTRSALLAQIDELLGNGARQFLIDVRGAYVCDANGLELLALCERHVRTVGGSLDWTGTKNAATGNQPLRTERVLGGMYVDRRANIAR